MKTNDLKKGSIVYLRHTDWKARIEDNMKGNIRLATVYGLFTEMGSIYSHDIIAYEDHTGKIKTDIELTDSQKKLMQQVKVMGF